MRGVLFQRDEATSKYTMPNLCQWGGKQWGGGVCVLTILRLFFATETILQHHVNGFLSKGGDLSKKHTSAAQRGVNAKLS